jgi:hypothetical protein
LPVNCANSGRAVALPGVRRLNMMVKAIANMDVLLSFISVLPGSVLPSDRHSLQNLISNLKPQISNLKMLPTPKIKRNLKHI